MKRYFAQLQDYNCVIFVDDNCKGFVIDETLFDVPLTLEVAKQSDYSNLDGCKTAEDCAFCIGTANAISNVIDVNFDEFENVIEF